MKNRILSIGIIGMMLFGIWETGKGQQGTPNYEENADVIEVTETAEPQLIGKIIGVGIEIGDIEALSEKVLGEPGRQCPYYVYFIWIDMERDDAGTRYGQRIVRLIAMDSDSFSPRHQDEINQMLEKEGKKRLPGWEEKEWWEAASIHIDYRSERYLFWHYVSPSPLPEECKWEDLYFGLDVKRGWLLNYWHGGRYLLYGDKFYLKMEESWEKPVMEQDADQRIARYEIRETQGECDGTVFPAVEVTGLTDEALQTRINGRLQEGLKRFIENEGWEDKAWRQELLDKTKIYISYKSDKWLSVVYSIPICDENELDDGILDLPVVLDMQTGERLRLDDFIEVEELKYWLVCRGKLPDDFTWQLQGILTPERQLFYGYSVNWYEDFSGYTALDRFYLSRGRLILLSHRSTSDENIPLAELFAYLKVDPWYD